MPAIRQGVLGLGGGRLAQNALVPRLQGQRSGSRLLSGEKKQFHYHFEMQCSVPPSPLLDGVGP